jgi:uncharacterized protein YndB with AHSA1/START domain
MDGPDDSRTERDDPSPGAPIPTPDSSSTTSELIEASPEQVFAVLVDPTTYPHWLVGARRIRGVDRHWPEVGSSFRHSIGFGPARVAGSTSVRRCREPEELVLAAGMGPLGEASVRFELEPAPEGTLVRLEEEPARGPVRGAWRLARPLVQLGLWGRNAASLEALARVVQSQGRR